MIFINLSCSTGTGKSVTGAHLAYALAMKLRSEVQWNTCSQANEDGHKEPRPRVMYCGPSQQSVNVVLGECTITDCVLDYNPFYYAFQEVGFIGKTICSV